MKKIIMIGFIVGLVLMGFMMTHHTATGKAVDAKQTIQEHYKNQGAMIDEILKDN